MADIQIIAEVVGQEGINSLIKSTQTLEGRVKTLSKAYQSGKIGPDQYNKGLSELRKTAQALYPTHQKASAVVTKLSKDYLAASKAQKEYTAAQRQEQAATKAYIQARREATQANQRFDAEQRRVAQANKLAEQATQKHNQETERLKLQYNSTYRAAQSFKTQLRELNEAHSRGAISADRHEQQVRELKNEYRAFLKDGGGPMNQFGQIASKNTRLMKRFGAVGMQQVGYQVQDFAVQVQSGTSALVALGQQGSQLLGILGPYGAIAGAVLAIGTGLANAFFSARKAADGMGKSVRELTKDIRDLTAVQNDSVRALQLGVTSEELSFIDRITLAKKEQEEAERQLAIRKEMAARQNEDSARFYEREAKALDKSKQAVADYQQQYEEFLEGRDLEKGLQKLKEVPDVATGLWDRLTDRIKGSIDSIKEQTSEVSRLAINYEPLSASARSFKEETQANISNMVSVFENAERLREELGDATFEAIRLGGVDMESGVDAAAVAAGRLAASLGVAFGYAVSLQNTGRDPKSGKVYSGRGGQDPRDMGGSAYDIQTAEAAEFLKNWKPPSSSGGGSGGGSGGKSPAEIAQESLDKLREQLQVEEALIGKSEERKRIIKSLGVEFVNQNPEIVNGLETQIQQIDEMTQREQQIKSFGETLKNSLGDAFLSIVDGSKSASDAFRDMARLVLKQAFELLVIKPILNSIFGGGGGGGFLSALFSANGNAFEQGGKVTAYANGGVVSAPTAFQHSGGLGVMGEAGPEAIMPLKRGKNGKLGVQMEGGNQGNVTVENHFHIAANGDESVKRIIAQEAPRIANLTQKQILDQRRRGGAMKATFG